MEWKKETLTSICRPSKEKLIVLFCLGLLLFVLSLPEEKVDAAAEISEEVSITSYETDLESRIRELLMGVDGVGTVEVMVVLKSAEETSIHTAFSEKSVYPELSGIIVSADGGGSAVVRGEISEALEALFGLPSHKIKVLKRVKKGV